MKFFKKSWLFIFLLSVFVFGSVIAYSVSKVYDTQALSRATPDILRVRGEYDKVRAASGRENLEEGDLCLEGFSDEGFSDEGFSDDDGFDDDRYNDDRYNGWENNWKWPGMMNGYGMMNSYGMMKVGGNYKYWALMRFGNFLFWIVFLVIVIFIFISASRLKVQGEHWTKKGSAPIKLVILATAWLVFGVAIKLIMFLYLFW